MTVEQDRVAEDGVTKLLDFESSRIQILSAPIQLPGVCGLCGTSRNDDRQYVDIGIWIEFYGQFYFCTVCITEFTNALGSYTSEQSKKLEDDLDAARQRILDFQVKEAAVNDTINALRATGLFDDDSLPGVIVPPSFIEQQEQHSNGGNSSGNKQDVIDTDNDVTEVTSKQRSDDVSSSRGNELDSWL